MKMNTKASKPPRHRRLRRRAHAVQHGLTVEVEQVKYALYRSFPEPLTAYQVEKITGMEFQRVRAALDLLVVREFAVMKSHGWLHAEPDAQTDLFDGTDVDAPSADTDDTMDGTL